MSASDSYPADEAARQQLRVLVDRHPGYAVVRVVGEVDVLTGDLLDERINDTLHAVPRRVVLDLREVGFFGATGLRVLVAARDTAWRLGVCLRLACTGRAVLMPLTLTGLLGEFDIYPDPRSALARPHQAARPACPTG